MLQFHFTRTCKFITFLVEHYQYRSLTFASRLAFISFIIAFLFTASLFTLFDTMDSNVPRNVDSYKGERGGERRGGEREREGRRERREERGGKYVHVGK